MQQWLNPDTVTVKYKPNVPRLFEDRAIVGLSGAIADSSVTVDARGVGLTMDVKHAALARMRRTLFFDLDSGQWRLFNDEIQVAPAHRGQSLLASSVWQQATFAGELHIRSIVATGVGDVETSARPPEDQLIGYWLLPQLGFDCRVADELLADWPRYENRPETLLELTSTDFGLAWWHRHGSKTRLTFDTQIGSASWARLIRYIENKRQLG